MAITKVERLMRGNKEETSMLRCIINGVECFVPQDTKNKHYAEILRMKDSGKIAIDEIDIEKNERPLKE